MALKVRCGGGGLKENMMNCQ